MPPGSLPLARELRPRAQLRRHAHAAGRRRRRPGWCAATLPHRPLAPLSRRTEDITIVVHAAHLELAHANAANARSPPGLQATARHTRNSSMRCHGVAARDMLVPAAALRNRCVRPTRTRLHPQHPHPHRHHCSTRLTLRKPLLLHMRHPSPPLALRLLRTSHTATSTTTVCIHSASTAVAIRMVGHRCQGLRAPGQLRGPAPGARTYTGRHCGGGGVARLAEPPQATHTSDVCRRRRATLQCVVRNSCGAWLQPAFAIVRGRAHILRLTVTSCRRERWHDCC